MMEITWTVFDEFSFDAWSANERSYWTDAPEIRPDYAEGAD